MHKSPVLDERYLGSGILIKEAVKKYGRETFNIEILKECDSKEELYSSEIYYIQKYEVHTKRKSTRV